MAGDRGCAAATKRAQLIRNTLYFHGNSITEPLIVLGIYVLVGLILMIIFSWGRLRWWLAETQGGAKRIGGVNSDEAIGTAAIPPA